MLTALRAAVAELLDTAFDLDVYDRVPDDVNALPCIVVGYPSAAPASETAVFDREVTVYAIARRHDAGDAEGELVTLADEMFVELGGTRGVRSSDGLHLTVERVTHRVIQIAGLDHDAYLFTIESPVATC